MEFGCKQDAFDNGSVHEKLPIKGYRRGINYTLTSPERDRLINIGLFPECFGPAIVAEHQDGSVEYEPGSAEEWSKQIDEWRERAAERSLPYRERTDGEEREYKKLLAHGLTRGQAMDTLVENEKRSLQEVAVKVNAAGAKAAHKVRA